MGASRTEALASRRATHQDVLDVISHFLAHRSMIELCEGMSFCNSP